MTPVTRYLLLLSLLGSVQCANEAPQDSSIVERRTRPSALALNAEVLELAELIENVTEADAYVYDAHDSAGHSMDTAKIIADPEGGYLAASHYSRGDEFEVTLSRSTDLINWTYVQSYGKNTSQPYLAMDSRGGFVLADELAGLPYTSLHLRYYANRKALFDNMPMREIIIPHTQVAPTEFAEGTPSIDEIVLAPDIDHSTIRIGFHYWKDGDVDRAATGVLTNFKDWKSQPEHEINKALVAQGIKGNIGDRDRIIFNGEPAMIHEGQLVKDDFGSWREFLFTRNGVRRLDIRTHGGSAAFCNATFTIVPGPSGGRVLVVTQFIPSETAAPGEAGSLIYYRTLND